MIFQYTWRQVLSGAKTQSRRPVKVGETSERIPDDSGFVSPADWTITAVLHESERRKWVVGRTYAVQPGRNQKAIGHIRITGIRRERVYDITEDDAYAEGCAPEPCPECGGRGYVVVTVPMPSEENPGEFVPMAEQRMCPTCLGTRGMSPREKFFATWNEIHKRPNTHWQDNPAVWVLEFELVKGNGVQ